LHERLGTPLPFDVDHREDERESMDHRALAAARSRWLAAVAVMVVVLLLVLMVLRSGVLFEALTRVFRDGP